MIRGILEKKVYNDEGSIVKRGKLLGEEKVRGHVHSMGRDCIILYSLGTLEHLVFNRFV